MTSTEDIVFEQRGRAGFVTLNKQSSLNAVTDDMLSRLNAMLDVWEDDDTIAHVVIRASEGRAFSAGGDIRHLYECGIAGDFDFDFFAREYVLNARIARLSKPYIALIDGIAMGGGVGVSFHGSHRVGGAGMSFAMPEVGIGFFPDVGGSYILSRLPGSLGLYLGLTGTRVGQADALWSGLITHAVSSEAFSACADALSEGGNPDAAFHPHLIVPEPGKLQRQSEWIDAVFSAPSVEHIFDRLVSYGDSDEERAWADATLKSLQQKCPVSLKVAFRQIVSGADLEIEDCMKMEYRILRRILPRSDFYEGIRAAIIDKDNAPVWDPARMDDVSDSDIDGFFEHLGEGELSLT